MAQPVRADLSMTMQEALAWAKARVSVLPDEFYNSLPAQLRSRTFTVSGMATIDQVQGVLDLMNKALANGQTMAQWQAGLSKEALSLGANRLDNIFRTGIQTHYNIGRTIRQRENITNRPYYMWDAINDSRTRPAHRKMDGFIAPMSDPIWQKWSAPAGFRCRCVRITLTEEQAIKRGYRPGQSWPDAQPDEGWAYEKADGQDAALDKLFRQKLGTAHPALAQKAAGLVDNGGMPPITNNFNFPPDFAVFSRGEIEGERQVAIVPADLKAILSSSSDALLLSQSTAKKQYRKHPDISPDDYRRIQTMLQDGEVRSDRDAHVGLIHEQGKWFYAVIKATKTGKAIYLQSFRRSNPSDVEEIRNRSKIIREQK